MAHDINNQVTLTSPRLKNCRDFRCLGRFLWSAQCWSCLRVSNSLYRCACPGFLRCLSFRSAVTVPPFPELDTPELVSHFVVL